MVLIEEYVKDTTGHGAYLKNISRTQQVVVLIEVYVKNTAGHGAY